MSPTQWVCETEPRCACVDTDDDPYTCDCTKDKGRRCIVCRKPMLQINVETGARVEPIVQSVAGGQLAFPASPLERRSRR